MRIAMINRNSVIVACTPWTVVSRSSVMSLIITFMFEPAKLQMNCASASGARNLRRETTEASGGTLESVPGADGPDKDACMPTTLRPVSVDRGYARASMPLYGRDAELAAVADALEHVQEG